jgi:hypothetical protein
MAHVRLPGPPLPSPAASHTVLECILLTRATVRSLAEQRPAAPPECDAVSLQLASAAGAATSRVVTLLDNGAARLPVEGAAFRDPFRHAAVARLNRLERARTRKTSAVLARHRAHDADARVAAKPGISATGAFRTILEQRRVGGAHPVALLAHGRRGPVFLVTAIWDARGLLHVQIALRVRPGSADCPGAARCPRSAGTPCSSARAGANRAAACAGSAFSARGGGVIAPGVAAASGGEEQRYEDRANDHACWCRDGRLPSVIRQHGSFFGLPSGGNALTGGRVGTTDSHGQLGCAPRRGDPADLQRGGRVRHARVCPACARVLLLQAQRHKHARAGRTGSEPEVASPAVRLGAPATGARAPPRSPERDHR